MLAFQGVIRPIIAIQDLPFVMFAWMEGKAFKTWLAETTSGSFIYDHEKYANTLLAPPPVCISFAHGGSGRVVGGGVAELAQGTATTATT